MMSDTTRDALLKARAALEVATTPLAKDRQEVLRARAAIDAAMAEHGEMPILVSSNGITTVKHAEEYGRACADAARKKDEALMRQALRVLNASIDVPAYGGHPAEEAVAAALRERLGEKE